MFAQLHLKFKKETSRFCQGVLAKFRGRESLFSNQFIVFFLVLAILQHASGCKKSVQTIKELKSVGNSKKAGEDGKNSFEEMEGILPIAKINVNSNGESLVCMGGYFGDSNFITAAHCLKSLATQNCSDKIKFSWFAKDKGKIKTMEAQSLCQKVVLKSTDTDTRDDILNDLAVIKLKKEGKFPKRSIVFFDKGSESFQNQSFFFLYGSSNEIVRLAGTIFEVSGAFFVSNMKHEPGLSGSPLIALPDFVGDQNTMIQLLGVHTGQLGGNARALTWETVKSFLETAK